MAGIVRPGGMQAGAIANREAVGRLVEAAGGHQIGPDEYWTPPGSSEGDLPSRPRAQQPTPDFFGFARLLRRPGVE